MIERTVVLPTERFNATLYADRPVARDDTLRAIDLAGGRARTLEDLGTLARHGATIDTGILMVDLSGADPASTAAVADRIEPVVAAGAIETIVALDLGQLDSVQSLTGGRLQLLCETTLVERTSALVLASERMRRVELHDVAREGEAEQLARLNSEVSRIAEVLARLTRRDLTSETARPPELTDYGAGYDPGTRPKIEPGLVRGIIRSRRMRDRFFGEGLFEDPAWDMLLDLFAAHLERGQVSVSSLCIASAVAPTTALRWIARMTDASLFVRHPDPFDRRRAFMELSPTALDGMYRYFGELRRAGLMND